MDGFGGVADKQMNKVEDQVTRARALQGGHQNVPKRSVSSLKCSKTKCLGPNLFDAKCTRLACLLSFASLLVPMSSLTHPIHMIISCDQDDPTKLCSFEREINKLAKLRRHASRVHFALIHFG